MTAWDGGLAERAGRGERCRSASAEPGCGRPSRKARQTGFAWARQEAWSASPPTGVTSPWRSTTRWWWRGRAGGARGHRSRGRFFAMIVAERPDELYHPPARRATIPRIRGGGRIDPSALVDSVGGAARRGRCRQQHRPARGRRRPGVDRRRRAHRGRRDPRFAKACTAKVVAGRRLHPACISAAWTTMRSSHCRAVVVRSAIRGEATTSGATRNIGVLVTSAMMPRSAQAPRFPTT